MENNYYVYQHVRLDTEAVFYVGKGRDKRAYTKSGRSQYWQNIVSKAGHRVEIVHAQLTEQESLDLEVETIAKYRAQGYTLCNMTDGGEGSSGYVTSAETIAKLVDSSHKKAVVNNFGEFYKGTRVAERATGVNCRLISACCLGNAKSAGERDGVKIVWAFEKDKDTLETRVIEANDAPILKPKKVINNFGEVYESGHSAERATGVSNANISLCCNGKYKSAGKRDGVKIVWVFEVDRDTLKQRVVEANEEHKRERKRVINNFGEVYESILLAGRATGVDSEYISSCCVGRKNFAGKRDGVKIVWVFEKDRGELEQRVVEANKAQSRKTANNFARPKKVTNNFGDVYNSLQAAARDTGIAGASISECCIGKAKSAGNRDGGKIVWVFEEDKDTLKQRIIEANNAHSPNPRKITNNFGEIYESISDAAKATSVARTNISACCLGKAKSAGKRDGVKIIWSFA